MSSWAGGHEDVICRSLPGAFERLCSPGFTEACSAPLAPLAKSLAVVTGLQLAAGLLSALLASLGFSLEQLSPPDLEPLPSLLTRWSNMGSTGTCSTGNSSLRDAWGLWLCLLMTSKDKAKPWDRWKLLGERAFKTLTAGQEASQQYMPLKTYVDVLSMGSALALWLAPLPASSRWQLCEILLAESNFAPTETLLAASGSDSLGRLAVATKDLCFVLHGLYGPCGALLPLAPHVDGANVGTESMLLAPLAEPAIVAVLRAPCLAFLAALSCAEASVAWPAIRSAPPSDSSSGEGLLPADLLAMLFVSHAVAASAAGGSSADAAGFLHPESMAASGALLKEALADVPFECSRTLEAGFAALLSRSWPPRSSLDHITGFRLVPTRFPSIVGTWSLTDSASQVIWSLQRFLATVDQSDLS